MAKRQDDLDRGVAAMLDLRASSNEVQFKVTRGVTRPVWEADAAGMALYETARGIAQSLGYHIAPQSSGGEFPRSRTMRALLSSRGLGAIGALAGGLLVARPTLALRLLRMVPVSAVGKILITKAITGLRARRGP